MKAADAMTTSVSVPMPRHLSAFRRTLRIAAVMVVLLSVPAFWLYSEFRYARLVSPAGIGTVKEFVARFGPPAELHRVHHEGLDYFELIGPLPVGWGLACPSGRPSYIFHSDGRFVTWSMDPEENGAFQREWRRAPDSALDSERRRA